MFSGCSGAAAHVTPADLSHANDNLSIYMRTQAGVGVSGSVFPAVHVAIDTLESRFQQW